MDHLWITESVAIPIPTFGRWADQPMETGKRVDMFPLQASEGFELGIDAYVKFIRKRGSRVVVLCNPNNPTAATCRAGRSSGSWTSRPTSTWW
jgi:histidinol-phosphate/aromatic aminotransferase/cobyric acid decarboxylase-like protein